MSSNSNPYLVLVFLAGVGSMLMVEKFQLWILVEISLLLMLMKLFEENSTLSATITFILVEISLSLCLLVSFLSNSLILAELFCLGKLGLFPFWFWVFRMFEGVEMSLMLWVMTAYKIIPLSLSFLLFPTNIIMPLVVLNSSILFYLLNSMYSIQQVFSSLVVFSTGWLVISFLSGSGVSILFFFIYFAMLAFLLMGEKEKSVTNISLLLYGGLPPFFSFFAKLLLLISNSNLLILAFIPLFLSLAVIFLLVTLLGEWKSLFLPLIVAFSVILLCHQSFNEALAF